MRSLRLAVCVVSALSASTAAAPASAANLLVNPYFHSNSIGWEIEKASSFDQADFEDEGGCDGSGAGQVTSESGGGGEQAAIRQCVPVAGGNTYFARARHKGSGTFTIHFRLFHTSGCGGIPDDSSEPPAAAQSPSEWRTFESSVFANLETESVEVVLVADHDSFHDLFVDAVELTLEPSIFVDDFEGNEGVEVQPCRWETP